MASYVSGWMTGWKVWTGAGMIIVSGVLQHYGMADQSTIMLRLGEALVLIGIGHKIEKSSNVKEK